MALGIAGYAVSLPRLRITREEYIKAWGQFAAAGVAEKTVLGHDEDVLTLAIRASRAALASAARPADSVTRFAFASTTPPYSEKFLSGTIMAGLGIREDAFASDHVTSTRAGTEAMLAGIEHVRARNGGVAIAAIADAPRASMNDPAEHALGAGAAAFVLAPDPILAELEGHATHASEHFGERYRPRGEDRIRDLGVRKFSESSFAANTSGAAEALLEQLGRKPADYAHVVFHQPDARVPANLAARLGFSAAQTASGLVVSYLGDLGAASTPIGLAAALDVARPGDRLLVVSYGSGAASDALSFRVVRDRPSAGGVRDEADRKEYIDYLRYVKLKGSLL